MAPRVTDELLDRLAELAHISIPDNKRASFKADLEQIIAFAGKVKDYPLDETPDEPEVSNSHLRADKTEPCLTPEEALANAPEVAGHFFAVPKVIRKDDNCSAQQ